MSQHTKELFFGLGKNQDPVHVTVRWPSGLTQAFDVLPVNHRIEIEEGARDFLAKPFATSAALVGPFGRHQGWRDSSVVVGTWLIEPVKAVDFSLPDDDGNLRDLRSLLEENKYLLLNFWVTSTPACSDQLRRFHRSHSALASAGLRVAAINVDDPSDPRAVRSFLAAEDLEFPILFATQEMAGIYNIVYRYLFDRHRDLSFPTSFLIDAAGNIVKIYQGILEPETLFLDLASAPTTPTDRARKALPFPGTLIRTHFNAMHLPMVWPSFSMDSSIKPRRSFKQVIAAKPDDPQAFYNLGTLYLRRNSLTEARQYLEQTVKLRPNYPEAWNNLGMLAAQAGNTEEAIRDFQQSLQLRPNYAIALLNLGNVYRRQGNLEESERFLMRALENDPDNPEINYSLGMLYAHAEPGRARGSVLGEGHKPSPGLLRRT